MLGDQSLKAHAARRPQQVRPDLAAFERIDEDTLRAPCKQALKARLAQVQRQPGRSPSPSTRMSKAQNWTSSSCLRECSALKSETPSTLRTTASLSSTNSLCQTLRELQISTQANRSVGQS
jgi:hypothetical protein